MKNKLVFAFLAVVLVVWVAGCSNSPTQSEAAPGTSELAEPLPSGGSSAAAGWRVCETKEKCLELAGCVTITTSFCDVAVGETVTIEIVSANGTLASGNPVAIKRVTPRSGNATATISQTRLSDKMVSVTLDSSSGGARTVHLKVFVDTGERIGVNLQLIRQRGEVTVL